MEIGKGFDKMLQTQTEASRKRQQAEPGSWLTGFLTTPMQVWMSEQRASKMVLGQIPCSNMWFLIWMIKTERQKMRRILMKGVRMRVKKTEMMMKGEGEEAEDKVTSTADG